MPFKNYPLCFDPIFKEKIWGGNQLQKLLNKPTQGNLIGESWEISTVKGDVSIVNNGVYKGKNLQELVNLYPQEILGSEVYKRFGSQFPLLFKLIDAAQDLSIQVHPNDALAMKRHQTFGKTEMWYIMEADKDARLIVGFNEKVSADTYINAVNNQNVESLLAKKKVKSGDVFYLETGTVHAIGAGILLAEIQQTSDITYRIYDFNRKDATGNYRELHTELAVDAINFDIVSTERNYTTHENVPNAVVQSPYFTTNFLPLKDQCTIATNGLSFKVLMCVEGAFDLINGTQVTSVKKGDSILLAASTQEYQLMGNASILEIYISE